MSKNNNKYFSLQAEKLELWKVASEVSRYFDVNIIVYDDIKEKLISIEFVELPLNKCLETLAWSVGVEYVCKEGIYFLGGNADNVEIMESTGINPEVAKIFSNKVSCVDDKLVVVGTEREVKRISDGIKKLQNKTSCLVKVSGYEITDDMIRKLGIDIDKAIKYSVSWESMLANQFNPLQMAVVSVAMSVQAEQNGEKMKQILNSYVGILSGRESKIQIGESVDRPIYTISQYGVQNVSGFSNQQTGLQVTIGGYSSQADEWAFNIFIENSTYQSDTKKNLFNVRNSVLLKKGETCLVGRIVKGIEKIQVTKGIPYLCDIPYLGYLFSVRTTEDNNKQVLFFLSFVDEKGYDSSRVPELKADR